MKQNITIEQLSKLSPEAREKLREWVDKTYILPIMDEDVLSGKFVTRDWGNLSPPLLSIGQMIEFLFENNAFIFAYDTEGAWLEKSQNIVLYWGDVKSDELCDKLWSAVKEVLNG